MARFSGVIITYFVLGVMMYGAGLVDPGSLGVLDVFFDVSEDGAVTTKEEPEGLLGKMGGTLQQVAGGLFGPILAIWEVVSGLIGLLFWPVSVLMRLGAPPEIILLFGGVPSVAFFVSVIRLVKESA